MAAKFGPGSIGQRGYTEGPTRQVVGVGESAEVVLVEGQGLDVKLNDPTVAMLSTTTAVDTSEPRRFIVTGVKSLGNAMLEAKAEGAEKPEAFMQIAVEKGPIVAPPTATTPTPGGKTPPDENITYKNAATQPLGDVPEELMDAADKGNIPIIQGALGKGWEDVHGKFVLRYFLYALQEMKNHAMPLRSAVLLVAQTGVETTYGQLGKNPAVNNFLSFQPGLETQAPIWTTLRTQFRAAGVFIDDHSSKRVNTPGGSEQTTPVPHYNDIRQSIKLHIEIVLPLIWPAILRQLKDPKTTPAQFADLVHRNKYSGAEYSIFADQHYKCNRFIKEMLSGLPTSLSQATRTWAARLKLQL